MWIPGPRSRPEKKERAQSERQLRFFYMIKMGSKTGFAYMTGGFD